MTKNLPFLALNSAEKREKEISVNIKYIERRCKLNAKCVFRTVRVYIMHTHIHTIACRQHTIVHITAKYSV